MYNFITQHWHTLSWAQYLKPVVSSVTVHLAPFTLSVLLPLSSPLLSSPLLSSPLWPLFCCLYLWVWVSFVCCLLFYLPHRSEIMWFLTFSSDLFRVEWYSPGLSTLSQVAVLHLFSRASSDPLYRCTMEWMSSFCSPLLKDFLLVSMPWPPWVMPQWTQGCIRLCESVFSYLYAGTQKRGSWVICSLFRVPSNGILEVLTQIYADRERLDRDTMLN